MGHNVFFVIATVIFCVIVSVVEGINIETRKHCCNLGTNYSSTGLDCRTFQPPLAGVDEADEKVCLSVVDVCCKKRFREIQCDTGKEDAKRGEVCTYDDEERKNCCEACQAGIDSGRATQPCTEGLGLGPPFDEVFTSCCDAASVTTTTTTTTVATTTQNSNTATERTSSSSSRSTPKRQSSFFSSSENICDSDICAQICEPVGDSYRCDCFKGYILMEDGISCKPQKRSLKKGGRCETHNPCDHDCTDTGTAIKCSCREGYELAADNRSCKDIDECALNLHDCLPMEECINEIGTYACYEPSIPEEDLGADFDKKCPPGYKFNVDNLVCDDIDECQFELMCIPPKTCKNTIGSFTCEGDDTPKCPPGFHFKPATQTCTDIDECITGENHCNKESQFCLNTKGNYTCVDKASKNMCPPGFKKNTFTQLCEDINECEENVELCNENEECVNEPGGHTCVPLSESKPPRPTTTSTTTTTRTTKPPTTPTTTRTTTPTTTRTTPPTTTRTTTSTTTTTTTTTTPRPVTCPGGYKYSVVINACVDINECLEDREACDSGQDCINTIGSFLCNCKSGFTKDPVTGACIDVNECQVGIHDCRGAERCDNTIGSYHCSRIFGCGTGYTLNYANGLCEDDDECVLGTHSCNELGANFKCRNILGSYRCEPVRFKPRPASPPPTFGTTPSTTTTQRTTPLAPTTTTRAYPTAPKTDAGPSQPSQTPSYATPSRTPSQVYPAPPRPPQTNYVTPFYQPYPTTPVRPVVVAPRIYPVQPASPVTPVQRYPLISGQLKKCLPGYVMNSRGDCVDIDECISNPCARHQKCLNFNGRYECASPMQCTIGFELNDAGDKCMDVNECSRGTHKCNPTQICKNGEGYYTCECPPGHHLSRITETCEDMDECKFFRPCGNHADCINTKGSYRCECKDGFRKNNNNFCDDVDECRETSGLCQHTCVNIWGSYRCSCKPGFTLNYDNRTCTDVDECERFKDRKLCVGTCKNTPGSYGCDCPKGYKLGGDGRVCRDIDECEQSNPCGPDDVCLNTRGGFKCYTIKCPKNYIKDPEHKARCKRLQSSCDLRDYDCLLKPEQYTYQYMTLVSNLPLPEGHIQLFQIKGPQWFTARAEFEMKLLDVVCPYGVDRVNERFFRKINNNFNSMQLYLVRPIQGPQEIKLQIEMRLYQGGIVIGDVVVYIIIVVSEYPF